MSTYDSFGTYDQIEPGPALGSGAGRFIATFHQACEIQSRTAAGQNDYGDDDGTLGTVWSGPCKLTDQAGREADQERDAQVGIFLLSLPPEAADFITGNSVVKVGAATFEVQGPPLVRATPRGPSHVTATLQAVTG